MIALCMICVQFASAQQNTADQETEKVSKENHKRMNDRISNLKNQQQQVMMNKGKSKDPEVNQAVENKISLLTKDLQAAEAKNAKLSELENNVKAAKAKKAKLEAEQQSEYQKNGSTANEAILKQRAALKDQVNEQYQLEVRQQFEINKLVNTP